MKLLLSTSFSLLFISVFAQNTITWNAPAEISSSPSFGNNFPRIVVDQSGDPMTTWGDGANLLFTKWNGTSFDAPMQLNPSGVTIASQGWMGPDIASKGDTVYAVYKQTPEVDTSSHIWCVRSFDGGATFSSPVRVEYIGTNISRFPTITVDDQGHPVVGFMEFTPSLGDPQWVVVRSSDFGNTFGSPVQASGWSSGTSEVCDCCPSKIISSGTTVAMPYRDNNSNIRDTWAGVSTDGGNTFPNGMPVDQQNWFIAACPSSGPDGVIIGDTLYTTFMNGASGSALAYYSKSSISAMTGSNAIPLDQTTPTALSQQNYPRVDHHAGSMAFVWKQISNGNQELAIQFTENIGTGMNTMQEIVVMDNIGGVDVAMHDGMLWVIWEDDISGTVKYRSGTYTSYVSHEEQQLETLQVYSNPGRINWMIGGSAIHDNATARLVSSTGQLIGVFNSEQNTITINNENLSTGVYFAHMNTSGGRRVVKLIKE